VVDGNPVDLVESFTYLGSIQTSDGYCRLDITRKFVFTKHWFCQSCYMHPKRGPNLPVTWEPSNPFTCQRGILGIRWHDFVRNLRFYYALVSLLCLTGLSEVAMPYSDMWQDCQSTLQHTRLCYAKSSYRLVDPQTLRENVHQVDPVPHGPTNSAAITTMFPLRLCGGKPLVAVTRERLYGPSRLSVNDNDDE